MPILKVPKRYELTKRSGRLRRNMTRQEKHIWYDYLRKLPFTINRQMIIGSYIVDFYCSKANLVIELDGSQHYTEQGKEYDEQRTAILEQYGVQVLRFTNLDVDRHLDAVCAQIDSTIERRVAELRG